MNEPLSNFDLINSMTKDLKLRSNIIDTTTLTGNENLERDIFKNRGHAILYEQPDINSSVGHWTALVRNGGKNEKCIYFDSYGDKLPSAQLKHILKQDFEYIYYNPVKFQSYKSSVCGRYALIVVALNKIIKDMDVGDIIDFLNAKPRNLTPDDYVLDITKDVKVG